MMEKKFREEIARRYLKEMTIAQAIPRINEALVLSQFDFRPPILDLGCGEGVFSRIVFGKSLIDVGLDIDRKSVKLAGKSGVYQKVVVASADKMPFEDAFFETVVSNSVLEHIEDADGVFKEVYRILKKGGRFIFIVPDKGAADYLFYAELLEKIKLKSLSKAYIRLKNKLYRHVHLEKRRFWEEIISKEGFRINKVVGFNSPETVRIIDLFSPLALPDYLLRRIFGHSFIFRPNFMVKMITPFILSHCRPVKESEATGWCFEVVKE